MIQAERKRKESVKAVLLKFCRFILASGAATAVDLILFYLLRQWAVPALWPDGAPALPPLIPDVGILLATAAARVCSAALNFLLNKNFVFRLKGQKNSLWKYILLCVCVMIADAALVRILTRLLLSPSAFVTTLVKAGVDTFLFIINFFIQKAWVFPQKQKTEETNQ